MLATRIYGNVLPLAPGLQATSLQAALCCESIMPQRGGVILSCLRVALYSKIQHRSQSPRCGAASPLSLLHPRPHPTPHCPPTPLNEPLHRASASTFRELMHPRRRNNPPHTPTNHLHKGMWHHDWVFLAWLLDFPLGRLTLHHFLLVLHDDHLDMDGHAGRGDGQPILNMQKVPKEPQTLKGDVEARRPKDAP